jgi:hypothetical protein
VVLAPISPAFGNIVDCERSHSNKAKTGQTNHWPHTLSIPVVQIVKPRNGLGQVSTKLISRSSCVCDDKNEGDGVRRRPCFFVSSGLAGRSFTPGTYNETVRWRRSAERPTCLL